MSSLSVIGWLRLKTRYTDMPWQDAFSAGRREGEGRVQACKTRGLPLYGARAAGEFKVNGSVYGPVPKILFLERNRKPGGTGVFWRTGVDRVVWIWELGNDRGGYLGRYQPANYHFAARVKHRNSPAEAIPKGTWNFRNIPRCGVIPFPGGAVVFFRSGCRLRATGAQAVFPAGPRSAF